MTPPTPERLTGGLLIPADRPDTSFHLTTVRALARLLDTAFAVPGTRFRFGLDPVLDLIPGVGDVAGAVIGSYILLAAARLGVPRAVLGRMLLNVGIDAVAGAAPFVGPVLDAAYRSNTRNLALLERALADPAQTRRASVWTMVGLGAALVVLFGGAIAASVWAIKQLWHLIP